MEAFLQIEKRRKKQEKYFWEGFFFCIFFGMFWFWFLSFSLFYCFIFRSFWISFDLLDISLEYWNFFQRWQGNYWPGVAVAILQTTLSFIDWLIQSSFSSQSSKHCLSQTVGAREMKLWENGHSPPPVTCHMSHVFCHLSCTLPVFFYD